MPRHDPTPLGDVLSKLVDSYGYRDRLDAARAVEAWPLVAGERVAAQTEQAWMRDGVLTVKVQSAAWRHQLHLQRDAWRQRLNDSLGREVVREIAFR